MLYVCWKTSWYLFKLSIYFVIEGALPKEYLSPAVGVSAIFLGDVQQMNDNRCVFPHFYVSQTAFDIRVNNFKVVFDD